MTSSARRFPGGVTCPRDLALRTVIRVGPAPHQWRRLQTHLDEDVPRDYAATAAGEALPSELRHSTTLAFESAKLRKTLAP